MKTLCIRLLVPVLFLASVSVFAQTDEVLLCGTDISGQQSPYAWHLVKDRLPMYLYPGDTEKVYQQLLDSYLLNLEQGDLQREQVKQFIAVQKSIIRGESSALMDIDPGLDTGYELISGHETVFIVPCESAQESWLINIAYLATAYRKIHNVSFEVFRETANATIQKRNLQYQNWFDNGLPMWPQETWLNGLFLDESDAQQPARLQWVLLRPSVGIGGNAHDGISNNKFAATLGLEVAGFAHYLNEDYSNYWGLSFLATIGEEVGVGYGALLRYNSYMLGFTHRKKDAALGIGENNDYIFIGFDLYQLAHDKKERFSGFKTKVRGITDKYD